MATSSAPMDPHPTHDSYGPSKPTTQTASRPVQPFLHRWLQSVPILYNWTPAFSPLKTAASRAGYGPHLIHGSLGPPDSSNQTAPQSVQLFLQGSLVWQTDRQTDHATVMRPNNNWNYSQAWTIRNYEDSEPCALSKLVLIIYRLSTSSDSLRQLNFWNCK